MEEKKNKLPASKINTGNVDFNDKQLDALSADQLKQYAIMQKGAEQTAKAIERAFRDISLDLDSFSVSKYEQQLVELSKKAAKAVAESEAMQNDPDAQGKLFSKLKDKFDANMIKEIQKEVDDLSFKHLVKEMEDSGDASEILKAKMMTVLEASKKYNEERGRVKKDESGNFDGFTEAGQKYYEAQLKAIGVYIDKTEQAKAATAALNNEIRKMGEAEFGPKVGSLTAITGEYWEAFEKGVNTNLLLLSEWDRKLIDIEKQTAAMAEQKNWQPGINTEQIDTFRAKLTWVAQFNGFQKIQQDIENLNFSTMIGQLERADQDTNKYANSVNKVKAAFLTLKEDAYKRLAAIGMAFKDLDGNIKFTSQEAATAFVDMTKNTFIFVDAIRQAKEELGKLKNNLQDTELRLSSDITDVQAERMSPAAANNFKYFETKKQIKEIGDLYQQAFKSKDLERAKELLSQMEAKVKSIETSGSDGNKLDGRIDVKEEELKKILAAYKAINDAEITGKEKQIKDITAMKDQAAKDIEAMKNLYTPLSKAASGYGVILDTNTGLTATWSDSSVKSVDAVNKAFEKLAKTIKNMPAPKKYDYDFYDSERALGGPVSSGKSYLVGEKGPEIFSPNSSGFITPNDKISSRDIVDINLNINGAESVQLQGDRVSIEKLERAFRNNARYAS